MEQTQNQQPTIQEIKKELLDQKKESTISLSSQLFQYVKDYWNNLKKDSPHTKPMVSKTKNREQYIKGYSKSKLAKDMNPLLEILIFDTFICYLLVSKTDLFRDVDPNLISIFGIVLNYVWFIFLYNGSKWIGLTVLIIRMICDSLDGMVARKYNKKTRLGGFLDTLGDAQFTAFMVYIVFWKLKQIIVKKLQSDSPIQQQQQQETDYKSELKGIDAVMIMAIMTFYVLWVMIEDRSGNYDHDDMHGFFEVLRIYATPIIGIPFILFIVFLF